jgi:hypothetical protein
VCVCRVVGGGGLFFFFFFFFLLPVWLVKEVTGVGIGSGKPGGAGVGLGAEVAWCGQCMPAWHPTLRDITPRLSSLTSSY